MFHHYITRFKENGVPYAEAWFQINIFGLTFCFSRRKIEIKEDPRIEKVTVSKKSDDTLITRIFQDEEGIKQITSDDYEVEIKTERSENMEEVREALKQWILNELKNTSSMETGSILPEMLNVYLALFAL